LLEADVAAPLGLHDTTIRLSAKQEARLIAGHDGRHRLAHAWNLDAMAGAGGIRSTADDMLTYLQAQLHPDAAGKGDSPASATLAQALALQHEPRADAYPKTRIALAWFLGIESGNYWHYGATGGYSSFALFNPVSDYALVVLYNATINSTMESCADRVGDHVAQRLAGKPAVLLDP
jgi:D-alanyl-D-alanine-carboxypeptidase/D-alanyl-D-alanine-endopeptidase